LICSDAAFQVYLAALINTGQKASIGPAVRQRDSILAVSSDSIASSPNTSFGTSSQDSSAAEPASGEAKPPLPPRSSSQDIAQLVLSGQAEHAASQSATSSPNLTKFSTALEANDSASPIQVSIVERKLSQLFRIRRTQCFILAGKGAWVPKIIRFISLVLVSSFCTSNQPTDSFHLIPSFPPISA
jgi:ATP-dependent metalloprotease